MAKSTKCEVCGVTLSHGATLCYKHKGMTKKAIKIYKQDKAHGKIGEPINWYIR